MVTSPVSAEDDRCSDGTSHVCKLHLIGRIQPRFEINNIPYHVQLTAMSTYVTISTSLNHLSYLSILSETPTSLTFS